MGRPKNTREQNIAAFWKRVKVGTANECWPWLAWIQTNGYGKFCEAHSNYHLPHRYAYALKHGEIPKGLLVCHKCDNRKCCNPDHLFLGTHKDNTQDSISKGRWLTGSRSPSAKLTDAQFDEIKRRYVPRRGVKKLADEFGIDPKYVWAIGHGKARISKATSFQP